MSTHIGTNPQQEEILYGSNDRLTNNLVAAANWLLCVNRDKEFNECYVNHFLNTIVKDLSFISARYKERKRNLGIKFNAPQDHHQRFA